MKRDLPKTIYVDVTALEEDDDISLETEEDDFSRDDEAMSDSCVPNCDRIPRLQPVHIIHSSSRTFRTGSAPPHLRHSASEIEKSVLSPDIPVSSPMPSGPIQRVNNVTPEPSVCTRETTMSESDSYDNYMLRVQYQYRLEKLATSMRDTDLTRSSIEGFRNRLMASSSMTTANGVMHDDYRSEMYAWIKQQRAPMNIG